MAAIEAHPVSDPIVALVDLGVVVTDAKWAKNRHGVTMTLTRDNSRMSLFDLFVKPVLQRSGGPGMVENRKIKTPLGSNSLVKRGGQDGFR